MSRRLARDGLSPGDVRPYDPCLQMAEAELVELPEPALVRRVELDSLDLVQLGPYLLLLHAQESAQALVEGAQAKADGIREKSRSDGAAEGREQARREAHPAAVALANAGQALIVFEEQMIERYTPEMVQLALEIAEKIVHKTLTVEPQIVASVLQCACQEVTHARHIRICLNPADYELLSEIRPDLLIKQNDGGRAVEVVPDAELDRGGCRLETEIGVVDATIPTQIAELRRQLLDEKSVNSTVAMPRANSLAAVSREL